MIKMRKSYSIQEFVNKRYDGSVEEVLRQNQMLFEKRFNQNLSDTIELEVVFESSYEMTDFYQTLKTSRNYQSLYKVKAHPYQALTLLVSGKETLFDYLGSKEPNLLTLSRNLQIDFKVNYVQSYSGTVFKGSVVNGELLSRHCLVEVSQVLPELTLGLLSQIGKTAHELDLLLTRIIPTKSQIIL